jgi:hypothetical protein
MRPTGWIKPIGFGLLSILCLSVAFLKLAGAFPANQIEDGHLVFEPAHVLGVVRFEEVREISFSLRNQSRESVQVLGANNLCGRVCLTAQGLPISIAPNSEETIRVEVAAGNLPGKFTQTLTFYTDCPGQNEVSLTFKGTLAAPLDPVVQIPHRAAR